MRITFTFYVKFVIQIVDLSQGYLKNIVCLMRDFVFLPLSIHLFYTVLFAKYSAFLTSNGSPATTH